MALQFGLVCDGSPHQVTAYEALPIDSLWVGGHIASPNPTPEAMVQLARLSASAQRVRIGTSILLLPLYPPAIVAKQIADIDIACDGRLTLGIGVGGEYPAEFRACGVPIGERGSRTDEAIGVLRSLWRGEPISHRGKHFDLEDVRIHPAPRQAGGPAIVVAGRRRAAMRRAALLGDGWMPYLYSPDRYARSVTEIRELAQSAGRDLTGFEWTAFVFVNVASDAGAARSQTASFLGGTYRQDFDEMLDRVAVTGTVAQVTDQLGQFRDAGAEHLIVAIATTTRPRAVAEMFAQEVIAQLR